MFSKGFVILTEDVLAGSRSRLGQHCHLGDFATPAEARAVGRAGKGLCSGLPDLSLDGVEGAAHGDRFEGEVPRHGQRHAEPLR